MPFAIGPQDDAHAAPRLDRGTRQTSVRLYNERLVLSLIRRHGALPKADLARQTGLSPPTVSAIVRQLEADGLLLREAPRRGRIGQPLVPLALNPEGAFALGAKIGRRSSELVLIDFVGRVRARRHETYPYPRPGPILDFVREESRALTAALAPAQRARLAGIGVATPFELWNWEDEVGAPPGTMQAWRDLDLQGAIGRLCDVPVYLCNDATAACAAELLFGTAPRHLDFLSIFIAWFIGGGLVINGNLFPGRSGYAGSLGQVLVPVPSMHGRAASRQLLDAASLYVLARQIRASGGDPRPLWESPEDWSTIAPYLDPWIAEAAAGIAHAIVAAVAIVELQAVVIDGAFPAAVRARLAAAVRAAAAALERKGLPPFAIVEGSIGGSARAIGGASLPFLAKFMRDRELLFREPERGATPAALHALRPSAF
jgi:predicted NBD/HSP70 family sugar kinase